MNAEPCQPLELLCEPVNPNHYRSIKNIDWQFKNTQKKGATNLLGRPEKNRYSMEKFFEDLIAAGFIVFVTLFPEQGR